jgi:hypothetical protein
MRVKCIQRWSFASFWYEGASRMGVAMPAIRYNRAAHAVGYIRVSKVGGREGDSFISPQLQREQIQAVARREGLEVVDVIEELDASGGDAARPGWNRAIEMVERGEVGGIAVWNFARFSRSVKDALAALERVEGAGGRVWSATEDFGDGTCGLAHTRFLGCTFPRPLGQSDRRSCPFLEALAHQESARGRVGAHARRRGVARYSHQSADGRP